MNHFQKARFKSYEMLLTESKNYESTVATIPIFQKTIERLKQITEAIDDLSKEQARDLKGITEDKNATLEQTIDLMLEVAGAIHAHAIVKGDITLQSVTNLKPSEVDHMDQTLVIKKAEIMLEEAKKLSVEELSDTGLTTDELGLYEDTIAKLRDTKNNRNEAGIDQSSATKQLAKLFEEANALKKNTLDKLAPQFERKAPEFYMKYKAATTVNYNRTVKKTEPDPKIKI